MSVDTVNLKLDTMIQLTHTDNYNTRSNYTHIKHTLALSLQHGTKVFHICDCFAHDDRWFSYADEYTNREGVHNEAVQVPSTSCIKADK